MASHELTIRQFAIFVAATAYVTEAERDEKGGFGFDVAQVPVKGKYDPAYNWRSAGYDQSELHPVANLTWQDANVFLNWLSREEGVRYRLPTEAEWEYACRAGSDSARQAGVSENEVTQIGNVADKSLRDADVVLAKGEGSTSVTSDDGFVFTAPVGSFRPNGFGLYDMTGNVCEWCSDIYQLDYYRNSPVDDPVGPKKGQFRSFRGGGWQAWPRHTRCANRARYGADFRSGYIGIRVVRELDHEIGGNPYETNSADTAPESNSTFTNSLGMKFSRIEAGDLLMGAMESRPRQKPHVVFVTQPFYLGVHEVTVGQFRQFVEATGYRTSAEAAGAGSPSIDNEADVSGNVPHTWRQSGFHRTDLHPVTHVSYQDAAAFIAWLSEKEARAYRLPTEAEWEYVCRPVAGGKRNVDLSNAADAAFARGLGPMKPVGGVAAEPFDDGYVYTAPVGSFESNSRGVHDLKGNVSEWCADWYDPDYYHHSPRNDPTGPDHGTERVIRGTHWSSTRRSGTGDISGRGHNTPEFFAPHLGFRVALSLPDSSGLSGGSQPPDNPATAPAEEPDLAGGKLGQPTVFEFADPWTQFDVGGNGQFFVFYHKDTGRLRVFNVTTQAVVHELTELPPDTLFAAGREAVFVARPGQGTLERISLQSLKREKVTTLPAGFTPHSLKIGSNAVSPLFVTGQSSAMLFDGQSLKQKTDTNLAYGNGGFEFELSADGQTSIGIVTRSHPAKWRRLTVGRSEVESFGSDRGGKQWFSVTADGSLILLYNRAFDRNLRKIPMGAFAGQRLLPTVDPRFFLAVKAGERDLSCQICNVADRRSLYTIRDFEEMYSDAGVRREVASRHLSSRRDSAFHFLPDLNLFVTLDWDRKRISVYSFDFERAVAAQNPKHIFVTSIPPVRAVRGSKLNHQFEVLSSRGNVEFQLETAIDGMTVSTDGRLTWDVPVDFSETTVSALLRASHEDAETLYKFDIDLENSEVNDSNASSISPESGPANGTPHLNSSKRPFIAKGEKPNLVVILAECMHWPLSAMKITAEELPGIGFLMREGVTFRNAFVATTVPTAARATILTGQWPWRLHSAANFMGTLPSEARTFVESLHQAGYYTSHTGIRWASGSADPPGRRPVGDKVTQTTDLSPHRRQAHLFWLPQFLPDRLKANRYGALKGEHLQVPAHLPDVKPIRGDLEAYEQEIKLFDRGVSRVLTRLRRTNELENTVIIVTSVFGAPLPRGKGNHYDFGTRVPLIVYCPGVAQPGRSVDQLVSQLDIAPTVYEIAGFDVPAELPGQSLLPLIKGGDEKVDSFVIHGRERYFPGQEAPDMGGYPTRAIRTTDFLYVYNFMPERWPAGTPDPSSAALPGAKLIDCLETPSREYLADNRGGDADHRRFWNLSFGKRPQVELYDLKTDPDQLQNVAAEPGYAEQVAALREKLMQNLMQSGDPRVTKHGPDFDSFPYTGWKPVPPK